MKNTQTLLALAAGLFTLAAIANPTNSTPADTHGRKAQQPTPVKMPLSATTGQPSAAAAPPIAADAADPVLVKGEGIEIRKSDFELEKKSVPPDQRTQLLINPERIRQALERMTLNRSLLDELDKAGFANDPFVQAELNYARNQKLVSMYVAKLTADLPLPDFEPAMRERYKLQASQLAQPEKVRASHILVTTKTRSKEEARKRAEEARVKAVAGAKFEDLVKEYSDDPAARRSSGDLGYFPAAQMVPEFSKAAFAMAKEGDISPVVETQFGFHVIRFVSRLPARTPPYDEVKSTYREDLTRQFREQQLRNKLDEIIIKKKPQVNMDEVTKLLDNDTARAAAGFNEKVRKEIEEDMRKKAEEEQRKKDS